TKRDIRVTKLDKSVGVVTHGNGLSRAMEGGDRGDATRARRLCNEGAAQVGEAHLHGGWKERRHHPGFQRVPWTGLLSGRPAEGSKEVAGAARPNSSPGRDEGRQR